MYVRESATSKGDALRRATFAVKVGPVWMPFDSPDHAWAIERFSGHGLAQRDAEWIAGVVERAEPLVRSGGFDVYHDGDRLLYTGAECGDEDLAPPFLLHVFPEDEGDLPAAHREHGYHILDFRFEERRLPLVSDSRDTPAPGGVGCAAVVDLPGYEVARILTGVPGESWLWHGEFEEGSVVDGRLLN